jgi:hypothetical protein
MKLTLIKLLLFCLIPAGAFFLFHAIRMVRKTFFGKVIIELPFSRESAIFEIPVDGVYTIWQKGQYLRKMPLDIFKPVIINLSTKERINLFPSIFRPNTNDGVTIKMEIYRFRLKAGTYSISLAEGRSVSKLESTLSAIVPAKKADLDKYFILVRESQPFYILIASILLMIVSLGLMTIGLILGISVR